MKEVYIGSGIVHSEVEAGGLTSLYSENWASESHITGCSRKETDRHL